MHSPDKIQAFLDLRSKGNCLAFISQDIDVPISTLSDWNRRYALEIDTSRATKWEFGEQTIGLNAEADLVRIAQRLHVCERELDRRPIAHMTTTELLRVISLWRREYFRRRNRLLAPLERPSRFPESKSDVPSEGARTSSPAATPESPLADNLPPVPTASAKPEPESKSEKTGIPDSSHSPTFSPAHPQAAVEPHDLKTFPDRSHAVPSPGGEGQGEGDLFSQRVSPANPAFFSLEDHVPIPARPWSPSDHFVYPPARAATLNYRDSEKTIIASTA
jgi:hypothetical protein